MLSLNLTDDLSSQVEDLIVLSLKKKNCLCLIKNICARPNGHTIYILH